jgi:7,8-dihydropterin-6-yl-methyl-4-(beta-D-ribofuranosyl)aminobenzene 5'-phosphate synthase
MSVRATVLCENSVYGKTDIIAEHGWSVWLETPAGPYLFDTGSGHGLLNNASVFNIPLEAAHGILISHHHSDHTSGLRDTLKTIGQRTERRTTAIYTHPDLFKDSFSETNGNLRFIGIPHSRSVLEAAGADFQLTTGCQEIAPGLAMTGEVPRRTNYEFGDQNLKHYDDSGHLVVDPIRDDQTVVVDTPEGLFVVLGCSHAGLINILTYIQEQTGESRFHTIMGGTHLGPVSEEQVTRTIDALHEFDIQRIGVSHCTGPKVAARMAHEFGERFFFCSVGTVAEA